MKTEDAWESYRLHQRDILMQCFEDADLIVRRRHSLFPKEETLMIVQLLFEKRCAPYKYYRDAWRAEQALAKRQASGAGNERATA